MQPPLRDGVSARDLWLPPGQWPDLASFLAHRFEGIHADVWRQRLKVGLVLDAWGRPLPPEAAYRAGERIWYYRDLPGEIEIPYEATILFQDQRLLIVDKPHFLPVVPSGQYLQHTVLVRLRRRLQLPYLAPLHRLDRGTAGVVMFSVDEASCAQYQALFAQRAVRKRYLALAVYRPELSTRQCRRSRIVPGQPFPRMSEVHGAANAETWIEHCEPLGDVARYTLRPLSGRRHQLRVHMAALGAPIVDDPLYGTEARHGQPDDPARPLRLLAHSIEFTDPVSGQRRAFESRRRLAGDQLFSDPPDTSTC